MARRLFLGIDVSTTGAKALLIDESGKVVASASTPLTLQTPKPLWSEQDPHEWWKGTAASIRKAPADAGADRRRRRRGRAHRPDARARAARRAAQRAAAGDPVERPAHRRRVRRDRAARRPRGADPRGRQRGADRLHRAEDPLGPQPRARGVREGEARPAAEGLRAPAPHRRGGDGQGRRLRHDPVRPEVARAGRRPVLDEARDPGRVAAADLRGPGDDGLRHAPRPRPRRASRPARRWWPAAATRRRARSGRAPCGRASSR